MSGWRWASQDLLKSQTSPSTTIETSSYLSQVTTHPSSINFLPLSKFTFFVNPSLYRNMQCNIFTGFKLSTEPTLKNGTILSLARPEVVTRTMNATIIIQSTFTNEIFIAFKSKWWVQYTGPYFGSLGECFIKEIDHVYSQVNTIGLELHT